ncbi:zinc-dependent alcohol dehydrogenase family protein [Sphingobacterium sp. B16(2022)]|uniref:zinc-dependent alcohol dehydrogenase family protein n=1 Tax=Sphingobacterium sp. B16(2022) TaxID=2914044 RepID=UPI0019D27CFA|nr:NAD(P)-dependent alcohol dehydrogenase [Sphingobacterium sp. B16(2022)]
MKFEITLKKNTEMNIPNLMKQWELSDFGLNNLKLNIVPVPTPGPKEVLVKTAAVSLNYRDHLVTSNGMGMPLAFPFVPASDMSGAVVKIGSRVSRFKINDKVISTNIAGWIEGPAPSPDIAPSLGGMGPGVLAEYVCLPEDWLSLAPKNLSPVESATLPCAGLTAWMAVFEKGKLKSNETLVVQGTGGVSLFAAQFAYSIGANILLTSSSDDKINRAKSLGISAGINRFNNEDWQHNVSQLTSGRGADLIIEMAGSENLQKSLDAVAQEGRIAIVGVLEAADATLPIFKVLSKRSSLLGIGVGSRKSLEAMCSYIDLHEIRPVIDAIYRFEDSPKAFDHLKRGAFGKVVIEIQ